MNQEVKCLRLRITFLSMNNVFFLIKRKPMTCSVWTEWIWNDQMTPDDDDDGGKYSTVDVLHKVFLLLLYCSWKMFPLVSQQKFYG